MWFVCIVVRDSSAERAPMDNAALRVRLLRMHPFLKHKILTDMMYSYNRPKRDDEKERHPEQLDCVLKDLQKDLEEIKFGKTSKTSQATCSLNGTWIAEVAGRYVEINNAIYGPANVKLRKPWRAKCRGFMGRKAWNATARIPFRAKRNFIILVAVMKKESRVATFMGECLVCRGREIVQGQWLISRHSRDCESLGATVEIVGDVWRKDTLQDLKAQRLQMMMKQKAMNSKSKEQQFSLKP